MKYSERIKKAEKLYDERVKVNDDPVKASGGWGTNEEVRLICEEIGKKIDIKKEHIVLEIGCGSGVLGNWMVKRCYQYYGLDISYLMLKTFKKHSQSDVHLLQGTTHVIPFLNNCFDVIIINGVTMYLDLETLLKTLNETKRVTKKGGVIFLGDNITPSGMYYEYTWFQKMSPFTQRIAKSYIKLRTIFARKKIFSSKKWANTYQEFSPSLIKKIFNDEAEIVITDSSARTVKAQKRKYYKTGNKRIDYTIKLRK